MVKLTKETNGEDEPDVTFSNRKSSDNPNKDEISLIQYENPSETEGNESEQIVQKIFSNPLLATKETERRKKYRSESENDNKSFVETEDEDESRDRKSGNKRRVRRESKHDGEEDENEEKDEHEKGESLTIPIDDDAEDVGDLPDAKLQKQSNSYAAKKTVAQGMMDIALITANANQLRFMLEYNRHSATFMINVVLITISLFLQVGVGVSLIFKGRLDMRGESKHQNAKRINNYVVVCVFLVTIINVFIASFTVTGSAPTAMTTVKPGPASR